MNCEQTRQLVDGYLDGELDLMRNLEIDQHLQECADCSMFYKNRQVVQTMMGHSSLYFKTPSDLQKKIQHTLRQNQPTQPSGLVMLPALQRWLPIAAVLVSVILVGVLWRTLSTNSADDPLTDEVLSSHVRSLMVDHLADVASSDQHTVKPWFDGKLNFSPSVIDLATQGFPLIGGRLDYLENKPVAALVYQRRKHIINLFIWPVANDNDHLLSSTSKQGYQVLHWTQAGMTYWAISDVNSSELQNFVQMLQSQIGLVATP